MSVSDKWNEKHTESGIWSPVNGSHINNEPVIDVYFQRGNKNLLLIFLIVRLMYIKCSCVLRHCRQICSVMHMHGH